MSHRSLITHIELQSLELEVLWTVAHLAQYLWFLKNVSMLNRPKSIKQLD